MWEAWWNGNCLLKLSKGPQWWVQNPTWQLHPFLEEVVWWFRKGVHDAKMTTKKWYSSSTRSTRKRRKFLWEHIDWFTKEVGEFNDELKCMIFEKGLRIYCVFREKVGLESARRMSDILIKAHMYINYEEKYWLKMWRKIKYRGTLWLAGWR